MCKTTVNDLQIMSWDLLDSWLSSLDPYVALGLNIFSYSDLKWIFSVRFAILVPRQNAQFFSQKFNIFKFVTPKMPLMLKSTLSKPLDNITHTLGDSNMQGCHFRGNTLEHPKRYFSWPFWKKRQKLTKKKLIRF